MPLLLTHVFLTVIDTCILLRLTHVPLTFIYYSDRLLTQVLLTDTFPSAKHIKLILISLTYLKLTDVSL